MKKLTICLITIICIIYTSCSKKMTPQKSDENIKMKGDAITYKTNIKELIQTKCSPCHTPSRGGFKANFENYNTAKKNINEMIIRVELSPSKKGYMPLKRPPLSADEIALLKKWKTNGTME